MNNELLSVLDYVEHEKGIERTVLLGAVKSALVSAARKTLNLENKEEIEVEISEKSGDIKILHNGKEINSPKFGRIAAQTAKQVIIQKIKEAERIAIYDDFKDKEGSVVSGTVHRIEKSYVVIDLGKAEAIIPKSEQVKKENYKMSERLRAYLLEVEKTPKGPKIVLSRKRKEFVFRLFEWEVPEIYESIVEIKAIARDPGDRTKIAVHSTDDKVDSVGACVGVRGARVKNIVSELKGEKIDIIRWSSDDKSYLTNALSPAEIKRIDLNKQKKNALILVEKDQLSLAIGKKGQNVRLASELTGWEIDIRTKEDLLEEKEVKFKDIPGVGKKTVENLKKAGFKNVRDLVKLDVKELSKVKGIGKTTAQKILDGVKDIMLKM